MLCTVVIEHCVVEEGAIPKKRSNSRARVDQHAGRQADLEEPGAYHALQRRQTEHDAMQDQCGGKNDTRLEASTGTEISVELYVQAEQHDQRREDRGGHAGDLHSVHRGWFFITGGFHHLRVSSMARASQPAQQQHDTDRGGQDHRGLPQGVVAAIARQHVGDDVGDAEVGHGALDVLGRHVLVNRSGGVAVVRHIQGAIDQGRTNEEHDRDRREAHGLLMFPWVSQGQGAENQDCGDASAYCGFRERHVDGVHQREQSGRQ